MLLILGNNDSRSKTWVEKIQFCGSFILLVVLSSTWSVDISVLTDDELKVLSDLSGFEITAEEMTWGWELIELLLLLLLLLL